ncbi:MAG: pseudouridine-5'-phosphate glycosidase [Firmicutes bacterium]|nr:pseudouridine-5'-phosphate glycosidase [Bacillota bacterium]
MPKLKAVQLSPEVNRALAENKAVVALESAIIAHGMPFPRNVETALALEDTVRENGAVPATIALLQGRLKAGLSPQEIAYLGKKGPAVHKVSKRDLPVLAAGGEDGATTVAATMIIAFMAGIEFFCTGGIGGVHRGGAQSMDFSADLEQLAQTPVLVVCSGAKSILDLGLTLEYLETKGVPVLGYQTRELPAFYTRKSGFKLEYCLHRPEEIAAVWAEKKAMALPGGVVVANPIPPESALDPDYMEQGIARALQKAAQLGLQGKEVTPFLLAQMGEITKGKSLEANIKLVLNNAKLAAQIAVASQTLT